MLRPTSLRPAFRSRAVCSTRFASTGSNPQLDAAQKKAQEVLSSTQQTATKAFESAKKIAGPLGETAGKYLASTMKSAGPLGERAGKLMGRYKEPVLYNFAVFREFAKQVYRAEGLSPPSSIDVVRSAYRTMWTNATSKAFWQNAISNGEVAKLGIYALEAYGIFKIGEMVGRRSIVGYNLD
ncbi:mitochondrial ATP synthase g subunit-domain-containing protein [Lentinula raphanica]|nr:mitochondrial ATP synthase g subunit-domain-containing protein [Lentinula raphanica]